MVLFWYSLIQGLILVLTSKSLGLERHVLDYSRFILKWVLCFVPLFLRNNTHWIKREMYTPLVQKRVRDSVVDMSLYLAVSCCEHPAENLHGADHREPP